MARSFNLGQLIEDDELNNWLSFFVFIFQISFFILSPFLQIWTLKICSSKYLEKNIARSFKLGSYK